MSSFARIIFSCFTVSFLAGCAIFTPSVSTGDAVPSPSVIEYQNTDYGFTFSLPDSWLGYSIVDTKWEGYVPGEQGRTIAEIGPIISIRHPAWTAAVPRQDIPIMIFTFAQWDSLGNDEFHIGAAPINPSELDRNTNYVFALPARYNFAFPVGFEEVDQIIANHPLHVF